ncbi:MAG: thiamine pyrophosphate-dependent enzyme, partial [Acidimicrobiia bacterium]|nr:thiamine pyrophosphate-dependent enzyme [Acidimicrobiia bacterium]
MVRIRRFEEEAGRLMEAGSIPGFLHLYVGQEAVAAGVIAHLSVDDQITSTHRGHGHLVAKGGDL